MKKGYLLLLIVTLLIPINAFATSGKLQGDSITSCNGQSYGKHGKDNHWHVAIKQGDYWYPDGSSLGGNPCSNNNDYNSNNNTPTNNNYNQKIVNTTPVIETPKSSDNLLKEIKINDDNIIISNYMEYETKSEKIIVKAIANNDKATLEYEQEKNLTIGVNKYNIKVTAENGDVNNYNINIKRIALSSNKDFKIYYKDKELEKNIFKKTIENIDVNSDVNNIKFDFELDDKNAKIEFFGNDNLKDGENKIKIVVTAEDGSTDTYTTIVDRTSKIVDIIATVITVFILIIAPIVAVIYVVIKQKSKKQNNQK